MNITKNAILYLRVSTEEQVDNFSLGTQEEICRREAKFRGYMVSKVFKEEGRSAKTIKGRAVLIELLDYCRKNKKDVQAVIVYKTDRLSRQIFDYLLIQQKLSGLGIKLISATEPTDDTAMGKFLGNFFAQIAQFDNDIRSERARTGMRARFNAGQYHGGKPPLGYVCLNGMAVKDPKTFDQMKMAWDLMETGTKTVREIDQILKDRGIIVRSKSLLRNFRSKFYTGILYSPTYKEEVQGQHTPMITIEQFNKVQEILDGKRKHRPALSRHNIDNPDFPLRRLIKCGRCGSNFTAGWSRGHGGRYPYYYCRLSKNCHSRFISRKTLHESMVNLLKSITISPKGRKIFLVLLKYEYKKKAVLITQKVVKRRQLLQKLHELQKTLIQKHLSGIYSDEIFKEQNALLENNIKAEEMMTDNILDTRYSFQSLSESITKFVDEPAYTYNEIDSSQIKVFLSLIFPCGFIWNYPGLAYKIINPLFTGTCAKIKNQYE